MRALYLNRSQPRLRIMPRQSLVFGKTEENSVAQFARLGGEVSIVSEHILNKPQTVEAVYCKPCNQKFRRVPAKRQIFILAAACSILAGVLISTFVYSSVGIPWSF